MLGIQSSLPAINPVKFRQHVSDDEIDQQIIPDSMPDEFSKEIIENERDEKLKKIEDAKTDFDKFAETLDKNPDKISKKASKLVRVASGLIGLAGTFVMAKYGSKVMIGTFRQFGKSQTAEGFIKGAKTAAGPIKTGAQAIGKAWSGFIGSPLLKAFKNSKMGKSVLKLAEKPIVKNTLEKLAGYKEAGKTLLKTVNGDKVQSVIENTMAASTTASVLIDDLAGRNANKSNLDMALGASGGDK